MSFIHWSTNNHGIVKNYSTINWKGSVSFLKSIMPQLAKFTYFTQFFWLFLLFLLSIFLNSMMEMEYLGSTEF